MSLSKSKIFDLCRTRVVRVALMWHSCYNYLICVTIVSHLCHSCCVRVACIWHSCCKVYQLIKSDEKKLNIVFNSFSSIIIPLLCKYAILSHVKIKKTTKFPLILLQRIKNLAQRTISMNLFCKLYAGKYFHYTETNSQGQSSFERKFKHHMFFLSQ